jgi:acyl-coenzyme A synthetase/AMP-(fatty) acid ligase
VRLSGDAIASAPGLPPCPLGDRIELCGTEQFRLLGRADDMVKLGGRRASLAGLNRILTAIAGVQDGVMVVPDDLDTRPSARLLAFVIAPGRSAEDILAELRRQVDPVFLPRRVVLVDRLPRNELGKLPRAALAPLLAQAAE